MKTVYCVEDDENIREMILYTLTQTGFSVLGFESAEPFFKQLKSKMPDIILLDVMLPDIDGMEILNSLKLSSITKDIPVIILCIINN